MKRLLILFLCLIATPASAYYEYDNYQVQQSRGSYNNNYTYYNKIGDTYYDSNGTSYTQSGNTLYSSNGKTYSQLGNMIQSSDGNTYIQNGNLIQEY